MKRVAPLFLFAALAIQLACAHARQMDHAQEPEPGVSPPHDEDSVPRVRKAPASTEGTRARNAKTDQRDAANDDKAPPLATSPAGLLEPGAVKRIQERLVERDYLPMEARSGKLDERTRSALRRLQRDHNLPETGTPDDSTLQKLGLDVGELTRSSGR